MSTYGDMRERIEDELGRPDLSANIRSAIKSAIVHYESERFYFNQARAARDTETGVKYYGMPSDFQIAHHITITVDDTRYALIPRQFNQLEEMDVRDEYTSRPQYWAVYARQLRLYPVPDDEYRLEFAYTKNFTELDEDSDSNAWTSDAEELIRARAKADVLENKIRGPEAFQEAALSRQRESMALARLRYETNAREATGIITPTRF